MRRALLLCSYVFASVMTVSCGGAVVDLPETLPTDAGAVGAVTGVPGEPFTPEALPARKGQVRVEVFVGTTESFGAPGSPAAFPLERGGAHPRADGPSARVPRINPEPAPIERRERVTITASGGDVPAFSETIEAVESITLTADEIERAPGEDVELTWFTRRTGEVVVTHVFSDSWRIDRLRFSIRDDGIIKDVGGYEIAFSVSAGVASGSTDILKGK